MPRLHYLELTKPRLVLLALLVSLSSFYMATIEKRIDGLLLFHMLFGAALLGGGVNALNQFLETDFDAKMRRTQNRPLPSGRVSRRNALLFGAALSLAGILYLWVWVNARSALVGLLILVSYVFLYTPLKRVTPWNTLFGALPGALPSLLGWIAVRPHVGREALVLFLILFVWQLPHFLAIAWVYREDYKKGGFRMLTLEDPDGKTTGWAILGLSVILFALSLAPAAIGFVGLTYLFLAIFFGVNLCGFALYLALHRLSHAREFIYGSTLYLFALNISLLIDKI